MPCMKTGSFPVCALSWDVDLDLGGRCGRIVLAAELVGVVVTRAHQRGAWDMVCRTNGAHWVSLQQHLGPCCLRHNSFVSRLAPACPGTVVHVGYCVCICRWARACDLPYKEKPSSLGHGPWLMFFCCRGQTSCTASVCTLPHGTMTSLVLKSRRAFVFPKSPPTCWQPLAPLAGAVCLP